MLNLGSIMGTRMRLDFSFLILIGLFVLLSLDGTGSWHLALLWAPVLFFSVLAHELGHAAAYGVLGKGPSLVILGQMGGLTYNDAPRKPWEQFIISVAGPLLSFVLAGVCWLLGSIAALQSDPMMSVLLPQMVWANIVWGFFNLAPIVPLDGGVATWSVAQGLMSQKAAYLFSVYSSIGFSVVGLIIALMLGWIFVAFFSGFFIYSNFKRLQLLKTPPETIEEEDELRGHDEEER